MKNYNIIKDTYSTSRYDNLHFAVSQYGSSYHREFFDLMVDAGMSKRQIFQSYMKYLRLHSHIATDILKEVNRRSSR
jgi:hypothetical protein